MKTAKKSSNLDMQNYFFNLAGTTVTENLQLFRRKPNAIKDLFGQLLELDTRCIDVNSMVKTDEGLQCGLTVFSFDPQNQSRSNTLLKIYQCALPLANTNTTLFAEAAIEIWKLNYLLTSNVINNNGNNNGHLDIQITNIVTFFETENNPKHVKYFESDWKNIMGSSLYQSNPNPFSTNKIGIYQAICVNTDPNIITMQMQIQTPKDPITTATTDVNIIHPDHDNHCNTNQGLNANLNDYNDNQNGVELELENIVSKQNNPRVETDHGSSHTIEMKVNDSYNYKSGKNTSDIEWKSKDDINININITPRNDLQPIKGLNYSKSGIVANFAAMAAMMDQIRDEYSDMVDVDKKHDKHQLGLPPMTQITTHLSHRDHIKPKKTMLNGNGGDHDHDEKELNSDTDVANLRSRSGSISAPIGFTPSFAD